MSNPFLFCDSNWEKFTKITEIVNCMLYNGGAKTREVAQGKNLSGQLHSGKLLDALVMSVSCGYDTAKQDR